MNKEEGSDLVTAKILKEIADQGLGLAAQPECKCFLASINDEEYEEIMTYNDILGHINRQGETEDSPDLWKFKRISGHQGPLKSTDKDYNGSSFNVRVEWDNGEMTYEPLSIIAADDPVSCAVYTKENGLLETPGWRQFKTLARKDRSNSKWLTKPSFILTAECQGTSSVTKSPMTMLRPCFSTRGMATPSGLTQKQWK